MISTKMQEAINSQIQHEFYSAYLYLSMSGYFESLNLTGFATWLRVQFAEEQAHALKFYDYLFERGGKVELKALDKPPVAWGSPMEAFKEVLAHEQKVTSLIYKLYEVAQVLLQWFITEQVEEEKNAADIIESLERIEAHETAILMLDHQLAKRGG